MKNNDVKIYIMYKDKKFDITLSEEVLNDFERQDIKSFILKEIEKTLSSLGK